MTTGRINQITNLRGTPRARRHRGRRHRTGPTLPADGERELRYKEGTHEAPGRRGSPGVPGETQTTIQLPPLSPSRPVRHAGVPTRSPWRTGVGCGMWPSGEGTGPCGHAGERRIPQGGSLQESRRQVWPAANHPQTPSVPGAKRPSDFGCRRRRIARAPRPGIPYDPPRLHFSPDAGVRGQRSDDCFYHPGEGC